MTWRDRSPPAEIATSGWEPCELHRRLALNSEGYQITWSACPQDQNEGFSAEAGPKREPQRMTERGEGCFGSRMHMHPWRGKWLLYLLSLAKLPERAENGQPFQVDSAE